MILKRLGTTSAREQGDLGLFYALGHGGQLSDDFEIAMA